MWNNADKALPPDGTWVDVWSLGERLTDIQYTRQDGFVMCRESGEEICIGDRVSHWMSIPDGPTPTP